MHTQGNVPQPLSERLTLTGLDVQSPGRILTVRPPIEKPVKTAQARFCEIARTAAAGHLDHGKPSEIAAR